MEVVSSILSQIAFTKTENESKRSLNYVSIDALIDRFHNGLFRVYVQICEMICPLFLERVIFGNYHTDIPHPTLLEN